MPGGSVMRTPAEAQKPAVYETVRLNVCMFASVGSLATAAGEMGTLTRLKDSAARADCVAGSSAVASAISRAQVEASVPMLPPSMMRQALMLPAADVGVNRQLPGRRVAETRVRRETTLTLTLSRSTGKGDLRRTAFQ